MKFAYNGCCCNYSLNNEALHRFNQIRSDKGLSLLEEGKDYNDRCAALQSDPSFVAVAEEFDGNVLEYCDLGIIDVTTQPHLHELYRQGKFDEIAKMIYADNCASSQDTDDSDDSDDSSEELSTNSSSDIADITKGEYPCSSLLDENFRPVNKY